jgi:hypothetical protein
MDLGEGDQWVGVNDTGMLLYLLQPGPKCVVFGEIVSNERFAEIFAEASKECGEKNTFSPGERKP